MLWYDPKKCQFFVNEINRGGLVKSSDLVYTTYALAWDTYLQIIENSETKSLFLSSKTYRSVFLDIVHGQAVENIEYMDILDAIFYKNNRFESNSSNILIKLFNFKYKTG